METGPTGLAVFLRVAIELAFKSGWIPINAEGMIFPARLRRRSKEAVANAEISKAKESTETRPRFARSGASEISRSQHTHIEERSTHLRSRDHGIRRVVLLGLRLAFNRSVVLGYRISLEQRRYAPSTINLRLAAVRKIAYEAADSGLLSPELAA
jgi:hypothetical protein